ncbi:hypothetical protein GCM10020229_20960 [Kitasatospora albolonga]
MRAGEAVGQPVGGLLGVLAGGAAADHFAAALAFQPGGHGDQRGGFGDVEVVGPGDLHLDRALAGVAAAVGEPFGDLGLAVGGGGCRRSDRGGRSRTCRGRPARRTPAPPAVALGHVVKKSHPGKASLPRSRPAHRDPARSLVRGRRRPAVTVGSGTAT